MLATDLLLLALDDERGTVLPQAAIGLDYGLAGAIVMELALCGCLRVGNDAVATTGTTTDDALLDDALRAIAATPGKDLPHRVWHLSRDPGGLRQRLLDRLVAQAETTAVTAAMMAAITASTVAATSAATTAACTASSVTCS
ncbi:MAG: GPP34 family phosphoprotein [Rhodanobacteraceae bacterium]